MKDEEIDAMEAGQELDLLVAERVMGWRNLEWRKGKNDGRTFSPEGYYGEGPDGACYLTHFYSTNIADAWKVIDKLRELGFWRRMDTPWINDGSPADKYWAGFTPHQTAGWNGRPDYWEEGDTLQLAICRAALKCCKNVADKKEDAKEASPSVRLISHRT